MSAGGTGAEIAGLDPELAHFPNRDRPPHVRVRVPVWADQEFVEQADVGVWAQVAAGDAALDHRRQLGVAGLDYLVAGRRAPGRRRWQSGTPGPGWPGHRAGWPAP